jgi:hypothetical protein
MVGNGIGAQGVNPRKSEFCGLMIGSAFSHISINN